jgi:hypothetical protein
MSARAGPYKALTSLFDFDLPQLIAMSASVGHLEKYPFRAACKSDSKNLFEFDHRERVRWGNWVSLI